jgi:dTDP-4-amino-4,6-dideoxygalactose transaminase
VIEHSKPWLTNKEFEAIQRVLNSGQISHGNLSYELEDKISSILKKQKTFLTGSGSSALYLILKILKIGDGDEVILPTYVCENVLQAVRHAGATPVLCDIGEYWVMDADSITPLITKHTKAIVLVHIFGINAWNEEFKNINIPIIEDICQSFGAPEDKKVTGTNTSWAFGSLHGTKCIGAGYGGFVSISDSNNLAESIKNDEIYGLLGSVSNLHAAVALSILDRYDEILERRSVIANYYFQKMPYELTKKIRDISSKTMYFRFPLCANRPWSEIY